jgi:hypothetical protein
LSQRYGRPELYSGRGGVNSMSTGEVLWLVLLGFIAVWACDLFGIWDALAGFINDRLRNERGRR